MIQSPNRSSASVVVSRIKVSVNCSRTAGTKPPRIRVVKESEQPYTAHRAHHTEAALGWCETAALRRRPCGVKTAIANLLTCDAACKEGSPANKRCNPKQPTIASILDFPLGRSLWKIQLRPDTQQLNIQCLNAPLSQNILYNEILVLESILSEC